MESITTLEKEHSALSEDAIGTLILGDMNVHEPSWLTFSHGSTPEGKALHKLCLDKGWKEHVRAPTRKQYLLDLVLSDLSNSVKTEVLPSIADHKLILL